MNAAPLLGVALAWAAYGAAHSLAASLAAKRWVASRWPQAPAGYRFAFNVLAVLLLVPPVYLTGAADGAPLWQWRGPYAWLADALALAAAAGFLWTLRAYDLGEFLGLAQWRRRAPAVEDQERFQLSPLHRYVRHPWYFLGLMMLWTRDMDAARLTAALVITAYLVVGARLEERKLLRYHGEVYRRYRERVPALLPCPWRHLDRAGAQALAAQAHARASPLDRPGRSAP